LLPTRIWTEAQIKIITADRCVLGPIRTRSSGSVETVCISNTILQAITTAADTAIALQDVKDAARFEQRLQQGVDPVSAHLRALAPGIGSLLGGPSSPPFSQPPPPDSDLQPLLVIVNDLVAGPSIYDTASFEAVPLSARTRALLADPGADAQQLNRALLNDAFPLELADLALGFADGDVCLSRCTVLGPLAVHRLQASECILQQLTQVDDTQDGCVRFSAWADGSILPRKYESVRIAQGAPLFTATDFGQPGYAQLTALADNAILPPTSPEDVRRNTITEGSEDGSEMGAYARDKNPIKGRALLIKFEEYMPAGLVPVPIYVT
jgi:hypothetical protein